MRKLLRCIIFLCVFGLAGSLSAQQTQDFSKVQVGIQKVSRSVYMLTGAGGNVAVSVGDDGFLLVDTSYAQMFKKIEAELAKLSSKPVRFVIDTHWHVDHASGNANFEKIGADIIAQET